MPQVVAALDEIAEGLARRLRDAALAERQLARFAFTDDPGPARPAGLAGDEAALAALAGDVTRRALGAALEGYPLLAVLGAEPVSMEVAADALGLPPLAVAERVGALAQVGLAARDLEHDRLAATPAGRGMVAMVDGLAAAVVARCRRDLAELA